MVKKFQKQEVIPLLRRRLTLEPNNSEAMHELGRIFLDRKQFDVAVGFLCQAIASERKNPAIYVAFGTALQRSGRNLEAACAFRQALALDATEASAYAGLGTVLAQGGDLELAIGCLHAAVKNAPTSQQYWAQLSSLLAETEDYAGAIRAAESARALPGSCREADFTIVNACLGTGRIKKALCGIRTLLRRFPDWADPCYLMGRTMMELNHPVDAQKYYRKAITREPTHVGAHLALAMSMLATGNFAEGWKGYERRFDLRKTRRSPAWRFLQELTEPMWAGEDLNGKTLLVCGEQGYGDIFQFIRFVPEFAAAGCRTILVVYPELVSLLRSIPGISVTLSYGDLIPRFDYHIALCSLPRVLGTTLSTIPCTVPYIQTPRARSGLQLRRTSAFKVGFCWSTNRLSSTDYRNVKLRLLEPLFRCRAISFYSLQMNDRADELLEYSDYPNVSDLKPMIRDFTDTAYFISQMDLIISIDTAVAHLAGALAVPVWVMLPFGAEWRWLSTENGKRWSEQTPWYPTMRLFRAASFNGWKGVVARIRRGLLEISERSIAASKREHQPSGT